MENISFMFSLCLNTNAASTIELKHVEEGHVQWWVQASLRTVDDRIKVLEWQGERYADCYMDRILGGSIVVNGGTSITGKTRFETM